MTKFLKIMTKFLKIMTKFLKIMTVFLKILINFLKIMTKFLKIMTKFSGVLLTYLTSYSPMSIPSLPRNLVDWNEKTLGYRRVSSLVLGVRVSPPWPVAWRKLTLPFQPSVTSWVTADYPVVGQERIRKSFFCFSWI